MKMYRKEVVYTYAQKKMVKKRWKRADGWSCAHDDDYVCAQYEHTHTHTHIHTYKEMPVVVLPTCCLNESMDGLKDMMCGRTTETQKKPPLYIKPPDALQFTRRRRREPATYHRMIQLVSNYVYICIYISHHSTYMH